MTSTCTPLDFKASLKSLSSSIQDAMISWHDVQTTALKTSSQPFLLRSSIAPLRKYLETHWTDILSYLQKCNEFGGDAILWQTTLQDGPDSAASSFLEDMASSSNELCHECEDLIRHSDNNMECLSSLTPQLSDLLRGSSRYAKITSSILNSLNSDNLPKTTAFLGITSPSDGLGAIAATKIGLTEIRNSLCMMHQFWTTASKMCHSLMESNASMAFERARQLGITWNEFQEEVLCAKVSIAKSLDAVVIEPASAFRRQPRRRGSSKSEASIPTSPPVQPRRMSNFDDAEVPKACWGFSFGEKRRR
ncbi:hypothetical protein FB451DRAFT_1279462 [Mycena latifolia]|nr:hypothetical protein FB451DRAFT_1279462 [Mycena latifolia]